EAARATTATAAPTVEAVAASAGVVAGEGAGGGGGGGGAGESFFELPNPFVAYENSCSRLSVFSRKCFGKPGAELSRLDITLEPGLAGRSGQHGKNVRHSSRGCLCACGRHGQV